MTTAARTNRPMGMTLERMRSPCLVETVWRFTRARVRVELRDVVEGLGVRHRVPRPDDLGRVAHQQPLDGNLEELARQRPRHRRHLDDRVGDMAWRAVGAYAAPQIGLD